MKRALAYSVAAACVAVLVYLVWSLSDVLLLAFGAILLALLLNVVAEPFRRWTPLPEVVCLTFAGLIVVFLIAGTSWVFGSQLSAEFSDVFQRASNALEQIRADLEAGPTGRFILQRMNASSISIPEMATRMVSISITLVAALAVMFVSAIYLAAQPELYKRGFVWLFPPRRHADVADLIETVGGALRRWLLGQMLEMAIIGALSALACYLIGLRSPLALGLIAFVAEFIPYIGPILAGIPAVLVALTQGHGEALWTLFAYLLIHEVEGNFVQPLIQRRLVYVPPAAMLLGIAAVGALFGFVGFVFAAPIVVVIFVTVQKLYVRDLLREPTSIAGQEDL